MVWHEEWQQPQVSRNHLFSHYYFDGHLLVQYYGTVEHAAQANKMLSLRERRYCNWLAGAQDGLWYDSCIEIVFWTFLAHPLFNAATHNHKPQLGPQHINTMTKCGKMEFCMHGFDAEYCILPESSCKYEDSYDCRDDSSHRNMKEIKVFVVCTMKFSRTCPTTCSACAACSTILPYCHTPAFCRLLDRALRASFSIAKPGGLTSQF